MSISEYEILRNKNKRIAIIYSLDDLFAYFVKICHQENSYYIGKEDNPDTFGNIEQAKKACRAYKVEEAYLALSNTYREVDATSDTPTHPIPRYDYKKILL